MSRDYKDIMQSRAEEIAEEKYGCEFFDLPRERRTEVFAQAIEDYNNAQADRFDELMERLRISD